MTNYPLTELPETPATCAPRMAELVRNTAETQISVRVNLDGTGVSRLHTGIGFFDHMLDQIARHGLIDLDIDAEGDLHIDGHHTVEDVGITLGQAVHKAVGDKKGIRRYGHAYVPLDEALSRVVVDFSGRPGLVMNVQFTSGDDWQPSTPNWCTSFFRVLSTTPWSLCTLTTSRADNAHHQARAMFKAFARAFACALEFDARARWPDPVHQGKFLDLWKIYL
jgi:imidazoleglycerol-phosphate dehydratase